MVTQIAIGISGGKDSLTLLYALQGLSRFYPKHFEVEAVTVSLGFPGFDLTPVKNLCHELGVRHTTVETQIGPLVFDTLKEENPCSLCARMRRGALEQYRLGALGATQVGPCPPAGRHLGSRAPFPALRRTFLLFPSKTALDKSGLTVIRPLMFVSEAEVIGFKNKYHLPVVKSLCPADGHTRRAYVRDLIHRLNRENPGASQRMFTAILNGTFPDWPA